MGQWITELERKPNLGETLDRFDAWWNCAAIDRPLYTAFVPAENAPTPPTLDRPLAELWMDAEWQLANAEASVHSRHYPAENVPCWYPNLGPEILAAPFGAELQFGSLEAWTSWSVPPYESPREAIGVRPNWGDRLWRTIEELELASLERGEGRWLTGFTDLHPNADLLASLVEPERLCVEVVDDPDGVREALEFLTPHCLEGYGRLVSSILAKGQPTTTWTPCPFRGRMHVASCDFSAMLSPISFRELVLPSIVQECRAVDRVLYHLDGPAALRHLDAILEVPEIHGLQWVYGAGHGPASRWLEVYRRAQGAGKCMQVLCEDADDARTLRRSLRPEGLWLDVGGVFTLDEVDGLLAGR